MEHIEVGENRRSGRAGGRSFLWNDVAKVTRRRRRILLCRILFYIGVQHSYKT